LKDLPLTNKKGLRIKKKKPHEISLKDLASNVEKLVQQNIRDIKNKQALGEWENK
jgi:hypothetical protein